MAKKTQDPNQLAKNNKIKRHRAPSGEHLRSRRSLINGSGTTDVRCVSAVSERRADSSKAEAGRGGSLGVIEIQGVIKIRRVLALAKVIFSIY